MGGTDTPLRHLRFISVWCVDLYVLITPRIQMQSFFPYNTTLVYPLQKCVKQLCVYHPRLQALKLSNRSKLTYDEQHISQETLSHLSVSLPQPVDEAIDLGCGDSREHMEEVDSLEDQADEVDDVTEGEDSNATIHVSDGAGG